MSEKSRNNNAAVSGGTVWFIGWLFTIGLADLGFWKGLLGLVVWPYFLGDTLQ
jgi:hypothetical protein